MEEAGGSNPPEPMIYYRKLMLNDYQTNVGCICILNEYNLYSEAVADILLCL